MCSPLWHLYMLYISIRNCRFISIPSTSTDDPFKLCGTCVNVAKFNTNSKYFEKVATVSGGSSATCLNLCNHPTIVVLKELFLSCLIWSQCLLLFFGAYHLQLLCRQLTAVFNVLSTHLSHLVNAVTFCL